MSLAEALHWTSAIIGFAVFFQTLELFSIRKSVQDHGVWNWNLVRKDFAPLPGWFRSALDLVLSYRGFLVILALRMVCAVWIGISPNASSAAILFITTLLISLRWRGSFNGGSDFMNLIVLSALTLATCFDNNPTIGTACLWYIAIQTCTSYFIAGAIKLRRENWRSGKALSGFLSTTIYSPDPLSTTLSGSPALARLASWAVITFECLFPLALLNSQACLVMMGWAILFHLSNFYFFGLNRFLLSWAAAYPALYYCSQL